MDNPNSLAKWSLSPLISKISYAILLSTLQQEQSTLLHLKSALRRGTSSYERTISTFNLVDRLIPGIADSLSRWMYENNRFPWEPTDIKLIAFGTGAAVFKLTWKNKVKVLRIYRKSLGKSSGELWRMADYYKKNYEMVNSWYGGMKDLVLPMEFMVLQGLPLIGPAAASFQPYIHGEKQDLFEDFSDAELLSLLGVNEFVRKQFIFFAEQTVRQWNGRKICYDMLGRENLVLVKQGKDYKLHIVDVGFFRFDLPASHTTGKMAQIERRIDRLAFLCGSAIRRSGESPST